MTLILLMLMPLAAWIGLNATSLVTVVFMRGEFTPEMAAIVSAALLGFLPSTVFPSLIYVLSEAFYAMDKIKVPAIVMPIGTALYLLFALVLTDRLGVFGLALSGSMSFVVVCIILTVTLSRTLERFQASRIATRFLKYALISFAAFWPPVAILESLEASPLVTVVGSLAVGGVLYVLILAVARDDGFTYAYKQLRDIRRSRKVVTES